MSQVKILSNNFVGLFAGGQTYRLAPAEIVRVLEEPEVEQVVSGSPMEPSAARITSLRDQIVMVVDTQRVVIEDQSGRDPCGSPFATKTSELLRILSNSGLHELRAYGTNCAIEVQTGSEEPIALRIADSALNMKRLRQVLGEDLSSGGLSIVVTTATARQTLTLEPRRKELSTPVLFAKLNIQHTAIAIGDMLAAGSLGEELCRTYKSLIDMTTQVLGLEIP